MPKPLAPGDRVQGKSKKLLGRRGIVLAVSKAGRMRTYTVQWDSGTSETVSARSICREAEGSVWVRPVLPQIAGGEAGLDDADLSDSGSDMSISSISSGEENASAAIAARCPEDERSQPVEGEVEDDGSVSAHGRKWVHCDAVYIDPASFGPARKAALHWPPHLQLGERSFASYFYLMYPMDSLQTTIAETNKLLSERHHGIIGRGELFRWIGIRGKCWNCRKLRSDSVRVRHRRVIENGEICTQRYEKRIPRPYMVELFFEYFSTVDVHDHYRQGSLEIEREWLTHSWAHRIFGTVLGMVVVDSYLAYRYEKRCDDIMACSAVGFGEFASRLAHQLIFNAYLTGRARRESNGGSDLDDTSLPAHTLLALGDRPEYQQLKNTSQRAQRRCKVCKKKASFYCATCSDCDADRYVALCGSMTGRTCYQQHLAASQHSL